MADKHGDAVAVAGSYTCQCKHFGLGLALCGYVMA